MLSYLDPYPFFVGLALGMAYYWLWNTYQTLRLGPTATFHGGLFFLLFFCWLGAKLFFLFFAGIPYSLWSSYLNTGGFMFHGGLLFGFFAYLALMLIDPSWRVLLGTLVSVTLIGQAIGRVGCYTSGCCYGAPVFGFIPVQLFESLGLVCIWLVHRWRLQQLRINHVLSLLGFYFFFTGVLRLWCEYYRRDARGTVLMPGIESKIGLTSFAALICLFLGVVFFVIRENLIRRDKQ